jgi:hypothetical protein
MASTRKDIWALVDANPWHDTIQAYARAVEVMQSRQPEDPTGWVYQAAIHGTYAAPPAGAQWNECQHANWFFLPWHRMYLYYFERIVRAASGDATFALPYWNYDQPSPRNTLPTPFRQPSRPAASTNPLFLPPPRRSRGIVQGGRLSPFVTSSRSALSQRSFSGPPGPGFGGVRRAPIGFDGTFGAVEQTPHNDIHVQIGGANVGMCQGGMMIDPNCAALDPIFWLHHCNVDRLWNRWIALGGGRANPTDAEWLNQSFSFHDENGVVVSLTCAQVVDAATQLDYVYDDDVQPSAVLMSPEPPIQPESVRPPRMMAASEQPVELSGQSASVQLAVPVATHAAMTTEAVAEATTVGDAAVYLNVEDIEAERNPGVVYGVFLNAPPEADETERARYHVGNITVFGIELANRDEPHRGVPGFRHTFDITQVVADLARSGNWDPNDIKVTFEPIAPIAEDVMESPLSDLAPVAAERPVRIGRVSLFMA